MKGNGFGAYTYLNKGMKGDAVRELQWDLENLGFQFPQYGKDGDFGAETETAVKNFQYTYGLPVTGVVDQGTANAIKNALSSDYAQLPPKIQTAIKMPTPTITEPGAPPIIPAAGMPSLPFIGQVDLKWVGLGILAVIFIFQFLRKRED